MSEQDLKDMIESLIIDLDPEHTFDHSLASWVVIDTYEDEPYISVYDEDDNLLFTQHARIKEEGA